jgi:hypothetical protein
MGILTLVVGLALLAASLLADQIGLGAMQGVFGWKQMVGAGVGVALVVVGGAMLARGAPPG